MLHNAALRQTGTGWEFASEEALEDSLEDNLQELLGLTFLKRQHHVREQYCDILAQRCAVRDCFVPRNAARLSDF